MEQNASSEPAISVAVVLNLPKRVFEEYAGRINAKSTDLAKVLEKTLAEASRYAVSEKPLYFDDGQRRELEKILGMNFSSPLEVINAVRNSMTVKVEGMELNLPIPLLKRLKTRCVRGDFPAWLSTQIRQWAESYTGLR